jgi:excisionase family DNA binding protein
MLLKCTGFVSVYFRRILRKRRWEEWLVQENAGLLTVEDVSERLGVGRVTIYRWCREGRLPCLKVGRGWRIRREALEDFLRGSEIPVTLAAQLQAFIRVPDSLIGIAQNRELLHRLDAAFFEVAAARGGLLVKFYGGEPDETEETLSEILRSNGLDVERLRNEGRFRFERDNDPAHGRVGSLQRLIEEAAVGRTIWATFNWTQHVDLDLALEQQESLAGLVDDQRLVVKTAVLEDIADGWAPDTRRRAQKVHSGTVWVSEAGVSLSRISPLPGQ